MVCAKVVSMCVTGAKVVGMCVAGAEVVSADVVDTFVDCSNADGASVVGTVAAGAIAGGAKWQTVMTIDGTVTDFRHDFGSDSDLCLGATAPYMAGLSSTLTHADGKD